MKSLDERLQAYSEGLRALETAYGVKLIPVLLAELPTGNVVAPRFIVLPPNTPVRGVLTFEAIEGWTPPADDVPKANSDGDVG